MASFGGMNINFGGMGGLVMGWATSLLFWAVIFILITIGFIVILKIRKWRRFEFPCAEIIGLGAGKIRLDISKAGWFKKRKIIFGLLDWSGEDELICKKGGRKIYYSSSIDYHDINGKRGIIVKRKDDDPEILVPLTKFELKNGKLLGEIAPADYRDTSLQLLEKYEKETMTWWQQNAPIIVLGGIIIFALIALIIIFNFAKGESAAWREFAEASKTAVAIASSAP